MRETPREFYERGLRELDERQVAELRRQGVGFGGGNPAGDYRWVFQFLVKRPDGMLVWRTARGIFQDTAQGAAEAGQKLTIVPENQRVRVTWMTPGEFRTALFIV